MPVSDATVQRHADTWGRKVPSGWSLRRFGDVLRTAQRRINIVDDVIYKQPVIRRNHGGIDLRAEQLGRDIKTKTQYELKARDWLMSKVQILHRAYGIVPEALDGSIASGSYYAFEVQEGLDLDYLWYLSQATQFHNACELASVGVVIEKMVFRVEDWLRFMVLLPPLAEQKRIAEILGSVDEAIQATQEVIDQTRKVKQGLLQQLLTRGIGHTRFKQTEIGEIPESWEVASAGEHCSLVTKGTTPKPEDQHSGEGEIPFLKVYNIDPEGCVDFAVRPTFVCRAVHEGFLRRSRVYPGDVLMNIVGPPLKKVAVVPETHPEWNINQAIAVYRCKDSLEPRFLQACLSSEHLFVWARARAKQTSGQKNLTLKLCADYPIPVPPQDEQKEICRRLAAYDEAENSQIQYLESLNACKGGLMADLLSGRVRVNP